MKIQLLTHTLDGLIDELDSQAQHSCDTTEILLVGGRVINLDCYPMLRGIFKTGVGTDNLPYEDAKSRGIEIALPTEATRQIIYEETANFTCQLILNTFYRDTGDFKAWNKKARPFLKRRNLLIIGLGKIGTLVKEKMSGFCDITTYDSLTNNESDLRDLIEAADCISIHLPLNNETRNFIDAEKLSWMKDGSSLVNTARGPIVDEVALYQELKSKRIFAAIDVFSEEPYTGPLRDLPADSVALSPHVASTCNEFLEETAKDFRAFVKEMESKNSKS